MNTVMSDVAMYVPRYESHCPAWLHRRQAPWDGQGGRRVHEILAYGTRVALVWAVVPIVSRIPGVRPLRQTQADQAVAAPPVDDAIRAFHVGFHSFDAGRPRLFPVSRVYRMMGAGASRPAVRTMSPIPARMVAGMVADARNTPT